MSQRYQKECKYCKNTIEMRNENGKWVPYNLDDSPHDCKKRLAASQSNGDVVRVKQPEEIGKATIEKPRIRAPISLVRLLGSNKPEALELSYKVFVNHIISEGAKIQGCQFHKDEGDWWVICVYYEVPNASLGGDID